MKHPKVKHPKVEPPKVEPPKMEHPKVEPMIRFVILVVGVMMGVMVMVGVAGAEEGGGGGGDWGELVFDPLIFYEKLSVHGGRDHFLDGVLEGDKKAQEDVGVQTGILQSVSWESIVLGGEDVGPLDVRMSIRLQEKARIWGEGANERETEIGLRELYGSYETEEGHGVKVGRILLPWSEGLAFRPLDVWGRERGEGIEDTYGDEEGRLMVVLNYLGEDWSLEAVGGGYDRGEVSAEDKERGAYEEDWYYGGRFSGSVGDVETGVVIQGGDRRRVGVGGSFFYSVNENFSFRGEGFVRQGTLRLMDGRVIGTLDEDVVVENPLRSWREGSDSLYSRLSLGFQWTGAVSDRYHDVVVEYMYDARGLDGDEWDKWKDLVKGHEASYRDASPLLKPLLGGNLRYDGLTLRQGEGLFRRHYVFVRWSPDVMLSPELSFLCTWDSCRVSGDVSYRDFGSPLEWRGGVIVHGGEGGAFGMLPEAYRVEAGFLFYGG